MEGERLEQQGVVRKWKRWDYTGENRGTGTVGKRGRDGKDVPSYSLVVVDKDMSIINHYFAL